MKRIFSLDQRVHGSGAVKAKWQRKTGNFLATVGVNRTVHIWDRHGSSIDVIDLAGNCVNLDWSNDGMLLAVIEEKTPTVTLWDATTKKRTEVNTMEKHQLTFLLWSKLGQTLAIGSAKGNLTLYNHQTTRKINIAGKHNKAITCGSWSDENTLCTGGKDCTISLTNENGDTLQQPQLHGEPSQIQWYQPPDDPDETTISMLINGETLYLWKSSDPEAPIELEFQPRYGKIVNYHWFGDRKVLLGFQKGYFVVISTIMSKIGQELHQSRNHSGSLVDTIISPTLNKAASCGDDKIQIRDLTDPSEEYATIRMYDDIDKLQGLEWSDDGQLLTVTLVNGAVYSYLTKLKMLGESCRTMVCHLSALQELSIAEPIREHAPVTKLPIMVEPSFVAVGPFHVAAGFNNSAFIYGLQDETYELIGPTAREYFGTVDQMQMNSDYAAALCDGELTLHEIEDIAPNVEVERKPITFPDRKDKGGGRVTAFTLTEHFCIYAVDNGTIKYFTLEDWVDVNEYRHVCGIRLMAADPTSTRLLFIDDKSDVFVYNPVTDESVRVPNPSATIEGILWDNVDSNDLLDDTMGFLLYDQDTLQVFRYDPEHYQGASVTLVGSTSRSQGTKPLVFNNGYLTSLMPSGKHSTRVLPTHAAAVDEQKTKSEPKDCTEQNMKLGRYAEAFVSALNMGNDSAGEEFLAQLYDAALKSTDIATAIRCAQLMGDPAKAQGLEPLLLVEDRKLLCGHVALLYKEFDVAEQLFLHSSDKVEALNMNRDLLRWEKALDQARALAPKEMPYISVEYANQLELTGQSQKALDNYTSGITGLQRDLAHDKRCKCGMARMLIKQGDMRKGTEIASEIDTPQLWRECAFILQGNNQMQEAAEMYVKGRQFDKAAQLYIKMKNWRRVSDILGDIQSPKIMVQYAKAREAEGSFREAADAYEKAKEYDSVVRICLEKLRDPDRAVETVTVSKSVEGAKMVAKFFMGLGDAGSAIKFLVMSGAEREAFKLAQSNGKMDDFADVLGDNGNITDYENVASHYDSIGDKINAGRFFLKAKNYDRSVKLLLSVVGEGTEHIDLAIEAVGEAKNDTLTRQVIDFLMGEVDGQPKDAKYLFNLYIALGQFPEAARTAVIIAKEEQNQGNYKVAHDVLFSMYRRLADEDIRIPNEMATNLMILHSYTIVKLQIRLKDPMKAARMLIRVANVISSFPAHVVNILTSTVIYCWKAGLKNSAFSWAAMLMRKEYRSQIEPQYKAKLEKIVRKPEKAEIEEGFSPCPFCGSNIVDSQLDCAECGSIIPYCVITGNHMVANDWSTLPCCKMPALHSEASAFFLGGEEPCPMCQVIPKAEDIRLENDATSLIKKYKHQFESKSSEA